MREIKFRAWDPERNHMCQIQSLAEFTCATINDQDACIKQWKRLVPMQFTGLKDKSGKEIYEGDVISKLHSDWPSCTDCHESPTEHMKSLEVKYHVVFKAGQFVGMRNTGSYNPWSTDNDGNTHTEIWSGKHGYVEIIGNIYENPDLISK